MFLYLLFIAPLELLMDLILKQSYVIFLSYGVAIIILSLIVYTILLPLYHCTDEKNIPDQIKEKVTCIKNNLKMQHIIILLENSLYNYRKGVQISINTLLTIYNKNRGI